MEQRYQGKWEENMTGDYCWMLKRDLPQKKSSKKNDATKVFRIQTVCGI